MHRNPCGRKQFAVPDTVVTQRIVSGDRDVGRRQAIKAIGAARRQRGRASAGSVPPAYHCENAATERVSRIGALAFSIADGDVLSHIVAGYQSN